MNESKTLYASSYNVRRTFLDLKAKNEKELSSLLDKRLSAFLSQNFNDLDLEKRLSAENKKVVALLLLYLSTSPEAFFRKYIEPWERPYKYVNEKDPCFHSKKNCAALASGFSGIRIPKFLKKKDKKAFDKLINRLAGDRDKKELIGDELVLEAVKIFLNDLNYKKEANNFKLELDEKANSGLANFEQEVAALKKEIYAIHDRFKGQIQKYVRNKGDIEKRLAKLSEQEVDVYWKTVAEIVGVNSSKEGFEYIYGEALFLMDQQDKINKQLGYLFISYSLLKAFESNRFTAEHFYKLHFRPCPCKYVVDDNTDDVF